MGISKLNLLYKETVLDHAQHPRHHGQLSAATAHLELRNPTCGDVIDVQAQIEANTIIDLKFDGIGCTISQSSASMMTVALIGQSVTNARELITSFSKLTIGESISTQADESLGDASILGTVAQFPARIKCATLPWHALDELLEKWETQK